MVSFILDASAVLRYMDGEAGAERVATVLRQYSEYSAKAIISAMHFGEIIGIFYRRHGLTGAQFWIEQLRAQELTIISVDAERAERSATIKAEYGIPYVDALAVKLTMTRPESILITADFDMKPAESFIHIEFLPIKSPH